MRVQYENECERAIFRNQAGPRRPPLTWTWTSHRRDHPFISQPGDVDLYSNERHSKRDIARPTSVNSSWFTRLSLSTAVQGDICPCPAAGQCFVRPRGGPQDSSCPLTNGDLDRRRPPRPNDFLPHAVSLEDYLNRATIPKSEPSSPFLTWTREKGGLYILYRPLSLLLSYPLKFELPTPKRIYDELKMKQHTSVLKIE